MVYILLQYLGVGSFAFMHWLFAIAVTLLLLDVFVQTDVLSICSRISMQYNSNPMVYCNIYSNIDARILFIRNYMA